MAPYPKGHPLYPKSTDEQVADLKAATLADIKSFYSGFYGSDHGYVSFIGDIDIDAIKSFLDKNFGHFNSKEPYAEIAEKYFDVPGGLQVIAIPDKKNALLYGGINIPLKESDPDYVALNMANQMLGGGGLSSRVPKRLREREGISYGAGTFVKGSNKYPNCTWGVYAIFNPIYKNRLDSAFKEEVNGALQEGFTADEYKTAVISWQGKRKTNLGMDEYLVYHLTNFMEQGKDLSFDMDFEEKAKKLTVDELNAVLKKYISLDKMMLIYAGDFKSN
jgi:zinc protease